MSQTQVTTRPDQTKPRDPEQTFNEAAQLELLELQKRRLAAKTKSNYEREIVPVREFFGELQLPAISIAEINKYQAWRAPKVGPIQINHEVNRLARILDRAGQWDRLKPAGRWGSATEERYRPLPPRDPARAKTQKKASYDRTSRKVNRRRRQIRQGARREAEALVAVLRELIDARQSKSRDAQIRKIVIELEPQMLQWESPSKKRAETVTRLYQELQKDGLQPSDLAPLRRLEQYLRQEAQSRNAVKRPYMKDYRASHRNKTNFQKKISYAKRRSETLPQRRRRRQREQADRDRFSSVMAGLLLVASRSPFDEDAALRLSLEARELSRNTGPSRRRARDLGDRIALLRNRGAPEEDLAVLEEARLALADAQPGRPLEKKLRVITKARIVLAASLANDGVPKLRMKDELFPRQHGGYERRKDDVKKLFGRNQPLIDAQRQRLAALSPGERDEAVAHARKVISS